MGSDGGGKRRKVFGGEAIGADDGREGSGFEGNDSIDHGLVGDQHRAGGQQAGVEVAVNQDEDFTHNAGPAA